MDANAPRPINPNASGAADRELQRRTTKLAALTGKTLKRFTTTLEYFVQSCTIDVVFSAHENTRRVYYRRLRWAIVELSPRDGRCLTERCRRVVRNASPYTPSDTPASASSPATVAPNRVVGPAAQASKAEAAGLGFFRKKPEETERNRKKPSSLVLTLFCSSHPQKQGCVALWKLLVGYGATTVTVWLVLAPSARRRVTQHQARRLPPRCRRRRSSHQRAM